MSSEHNKKVSLKYYDYKPEDMDEILTPDFIGHIQLPNGGGEHTWDKEMHRKYWKQKNSEGPTNHTLHSRVADGEMVANRISFAEGTEYMSFMRFEGGKIAEIWELFAPPKTEAE